MYCITNKSVHKLHETGSRSDQLFFIKFTDTSKIAGMSTGQDIAIYKLFVSSSAYSSNIMFSKMLVVLELTDSSDREFQWSTVLLLKKYLLTSNLNLLLYNLLLYRLFLLHPTSYIPFIILKVSIKSLPARLFLHRLWSFLAGTAVAHYYND